MFLSSLALVLTVLAEINPAPLTLVAAAEADSIVVREPVKLTVVLKNVSEDTVRVFSISSHSGDMECYLLEVVPPTGAAQFRRTEMMAGGGSAEPLPPGGTIHCTLYPNCTAEWDSEYHRYGPEAWQPTFDSPGVYRIRVVYFVPSDRPDLWRGTNGMLFSNSIRFVVRPPQVDESLILDAIWKSAAPCTQDYEFTPCDKEALRQAMSEYPRSSLTRYVRFELAKTLTRENGVGREEAVRLFEELLTQDPGFREEEVSYWLRKAAVALGQWELAVKTMADLLARRPELKNNWRVMLAYFSARDRHDPVALRQWENSRLGLVLPDSARE